MDNPFKVKVIPRKFKDRDKARILTAILNQPEERERIRREAEKQMIKLMMFGG